MQAIYGMDDRCTQTILAICVVLILITAGSYIMLAVINDFLKVGGLVELTICTLTIHKLLYSSYEVMNFYN